MTDRRDFLSRLLAYIPALALTHRPSKVRSEVRRFGTISDPVARIDGREKRNVDGRTIWKLSLAYAWPSSPEHTSATDRRYLASMFRSGDTLMLSHEKQFLTPVMCVGCDSESVLIDCPMHILRGDVLHFIITDDGYTA